MHKTASGTRKVCSAAAALLLLPATGSLAQNMPVEIPGLYNTERLEWERVDAYMSAKEYQKASRQNRQVFREAAHRAIESTLISYGIPRQGVAIAGAAVGVATKGAKMNLNSSKTLSMEVKNAISEDRAISFKLKLGW